MNFPEKNFNEQKSFPFLSKNSYPKKWNSSSFKKLKFEDKKNATTDKNKNKFSSKMKIKPFPKN